VVYRSAALSSLEAAGSVVIDVTGGVGGDPGAQGERGIGGTGGSRGAGSSSWHCSDPPPDIGPPGPLGPDSTLKDPEKSIEGPPGAKKDL
jgi:hypothetical protein